MLSVREELRRRVMTGNIAEFALCSDVEVKYRNEPDYRRVLKIEFQNGTAESAVYHFPLTVKDGKASVDSKYLTVDLEERLI